MEIADAGSPSINALLSSIDKIPAIGPLKDYDKIPFGTLAVGILIGFIFRVFEAAR